MVVEQNERANSSTAATRAPPIHVLVNGRNQAVSYVVQADD